MKVNPSMHCVNRQQQKNDWSMIDLEASDWLPYKKYMGY